MEQSLERLEQLLHVVERVRAFCSSVQGKARARALGRKSGVPRGSWAYWKGAHTIAEKVLRLLE